MISIQTENMLSLDINRKMLEAGISLTLSEFNQPDVDLTLRLTDDSEMASFNRAYRGLDGTTDVLSFNQDFIDPDTGRRYLGDIVISVESAQKQAYEHGHTLNEECTFLAIHGTLHLLGFDHDTSTKTIEMWKLQKNLFDQAKSKFQEIQDEKPKKH